LVTYGRKDTLPTTANYNSACGGNDPASYRRKDGKQKPVVFLLGPVHGGEFEGIVGLNNLLSVAETGQDFRGRAWPELGANLARCRVLIVPVGIQTAAPGARWIAGWVLTTTRSGASRWVRSRVEAISSGQVW